MKKIAMFLAVMLVAVAAVFGGDGVDWLEGSTLALAPLATQKAVFLNSVKEEYDGIEKGWLEKAEDLSVFVKDGQTIIFPESGVDPKVYKNRREDIDSVEPEETVYKEDLDYYDTQNYKMRNIDLHALSFDKVQHYTKKAAQALIKSELKDAAYAFAPTKAGKKVIVLGATGAASGGFKSLQLSDIISFAQAADKNKFPTEGRNIVLPSDMWWQLVNNNDILKGQLQNGVQNGIIMPKVVNFYGINIHKSLGDSLMIGYDVSTNQKAAQGAAITGNVVPAGFFFVGSEVYRAGGQYEMFFKNKSENTEGRAYEVGFAHRFKAGHQMSGDRYSGLLYLPKAE